MSLEDKDEPLRDLGVFFVHGIGQSARGETLLRFGEPLRACIKSTAAPADPNANGLVNARIVAARLDPEPGDGPARAELRITGASAIEHRWLFAEAWWAKKFPTPAFTEIVAWSFQVLPWTLIAHFDRRFRRLGFRFSRALRGISPFRRAPKLLLHLAARGAEVDCRARNVTISALHCWRSVLARYRAVRACA